MNDSRPGFRIAASWDRGTAESSEQSSGIPTPTISDAMHRLGAMDSGIRALHSRAQCAGPALTVWTRAGDNLMIHKAINMAKPGDVLVINGQGDLTRALLGELMCSSAKELGIAGVVVDGAVRDICAIAEMSFPVFGRGAAPGGPFKNGPGEIGFPVACGGVVCSPGDLVVGDADGVVVVPKQDAVSVLDRAASIQQGEERRRREISSGQPQRSGIDEILEREGVINPQGR